MEARLRGELLGGERAGGCGRRQYLDPLRIELWLAARGLVEGWIGRWRLERWLVGDRSEVDAGEKWLALVGCG